eukprot:2212960-Rhodomonas_salina.1
MPYGVFSGGLVAATLPPLLSYACTTSSSLIPSAVPPLPTYAPYGMSSTSLMAAILLSYACPICDFQS